MPVDPGPLIDDLTKTVDGLTAKVNAMQATSEKVTEELTARVKDLQATSEKLSDEHAGKFQAALAALKAMLA